MSEYIESVLGFLLFLGLIALCWWNDRAEQRRQEWRDYMYDKLR